MLNTSRAPKIKAWNGPDATQTLVTARTVAREKELRKIAKRKPAETATERQLAALTKAAADHAQAKRSTAAWRAEVQAAYREVKSVPCLASERKLAELFGYRR